MSDKALRQQAIWWLAAALPGLLVAGYARLLGTDLWWHLAAGNFMVEHGRIVTDDPFSFTASGAEWIHHEWLNDVIWALWVQSLAVVLGLINIGAVKQAGKMLKRLDSLAPEGYLAAARLRTDDARVAAQVLRNGLELHSDPLLAAELA